MTLRFFAASLLFSLHVLAEKPNVLFICTDDMRPQLGCYGDKDVKSPHLDALASRGMVFERSYVQQALCSPSRISMLSGRYPATTQIFEIGRTLRTTMPGIVTMPQHFKKHGYHTRSLGKVYHVGIDDDASWSIPAWHSKKPRTSLAVKADTERFIKESKAAGKVLPERGPGSRTSTVPPFEAVEGEDDALLDGDTATNAIAQLRDHAQNKEQPFFLAVGFVNPHVPWISPKKYWDLYDPSSFTLAKNTFLPKGAPEFAATAGRDFRGYKGVEERFFVGDVSEDFARQCLHGYYAAISYVDAQVGRLLATLEETGLAKNTIVVFWSDHGYYMGEHTWWGCKHNNYEGATRNTLILAAPEAKAKGQKTQALVQAVDLAPTLTELCGLPAEPGFQGRSFAPVLQDAAAQVNDAAYSWYPKSGYLGVALRTAEWRYVEWTKPGAETQRELYDVRADFQNDSNLAASAEHSELVKKLSAQLRAKFPVQVFKEPGVMKKGKGKK